MVCVCVCVLTNEHVNIIARPEAEGDIWCEERESSRGMDNIAQ